MAKNNKNLVWWIILGLVVVFVFLPKSGFLGSLLTICDNTEPASFASFANSTPTDQTTFNIENGTATFPTNQIGALKIVNIGSQNCAMLLTYLNGTKDAYGLHETIVKDGKIYWCNKAGTTILYTTDANELASYYTKYEVCRTQNYTGTAYEADPAICVSHFGNWTGNACICPDGSKLEINDECEQPRAITPTSQTNTSSNITTPIKTTTPKTTTTPPPPEKEDRTTVYVLGGIAVVALIYFGYNTLKKKKR